MDELEKKYEEGINWKIIFNKAEYKIIIMIKDDEINYLIYFVTNVKKFNYLYSEILQYTKLNKILVLVYNFWKKLLLFFVRGGSNEIIIMKNSVSNLIAIFNFNIKKF